MTAWDTCRTVNVSNLITVNRAATPKNYLSMRWINNHHKSELPSFNLVFILKPLSIPSLTGQKCHLRDTLVDLGLVTVYEIVMNDYDGILNLFEQHVVR